MINVTINGIQYSADSDIVYNRNRLETADFGSFKIVSSRESRFEPYTKVTLGDEQYLIQADTPLKVGVDLWEHSITLTENISYFTTIFPVDRQFTKQPSLTLNEILAIYKREIGFYQNILIEYDDTDTIYNKKIINKQNQGQNLAVILYDLFRSIKAIPRVTWENNKWNISYELYTERGVELTVNPETRQSNVNDISYATEVIAKTRNAIDEEKGIWYPAKDKYVTPRSKSTMVETSDLVYELDSDISVIYQARVKVPCTYQRFEDDTVYDEEADIIIDFTKGLRLEDDYRTLEKNTGSPNPQTPIDLNTAPEYKNNNLYYNAGSNLIEGLYWKENGGIFSANITPLVNIIWSYLEATTIAQLGSDLSDYLPNTVQPKSLDIYTTECQFYYRPQRDIDFATEKADITNFNRSTILNNQKDGSVDISSHMENAHAIANRIGNEIKGLKESFDSIEEAWSKGDYVIIDDEYWVITNIKYIVDTLNVQCIADFTKNFSNTNRETGVTREPSAFVYTGKSIQSNFILKEYLVFYKDTTTRLENSNFKDQAQSTIMNIFDYDSANNLPLTNACYKRVGSSKYIDMPIYPMGGGNVIGLHVAFNNALVGGYSLKKINSAWYRTPVYYVDSDYNLDSAILRLANSYNEIEDTSTYKYYPEVNANSDLYTENIKLPFDLDVNDKLGITFEIIVVSESSDIIVNNGFAKYNNLIREYDTTPAIKLYSDTEPFTVLDTKPRGTEITGNITLTDSSLTVLDALNDTIEYWCISYNDEILISANNNTSVLKYLFTKIRKDYEYIPFFVDGELNMSIGFEATGSIQRLEVDLELELLAEGRLQKVFNASPVLALDMTELAEGYKIVTFNVDANLDLSLTEEAESHKIATFNVDSLLELKIDGTGTGRRLVTFNGDGVLALDISFAYVGGKGIFQWLDSNSSYYASASTKYSIMSDTTVTALPNVSGYNNGDALKNTIYNLQSTLESEYNSATTKLDIAYSSGTVTNSTDTETVESIFQSNYPSDYATFIAGNMTDTVIKITDQNLNVTYWKEDYSTVEYYKAGYGL